jgi:hypothetical protein
MHIATLGLLAVMMWLIWLNPNPAGDLMQITAAMIIQLIVLINHQHLVDRQDPPLPTLVQLGEWNLARAREPGSTVAGSVRIPASVTPKQKSAVIALMRETFNQRGHFTYRSPMSVLYYERLSGADRSPAHLALLERTGGAALYGGVPRVAAESEHSPSELVAAFRSLFSDGVVFDTESCSGAEAMRSLDPEVLGAAIPAALSGLENGESTVASSGRWLTALYRRGVLRLIFVLPRDPGPAAVKAWREVVRRNG